MHKSIQVFTETEDKLLDEILETITRSGSRHDVSKIASNLSSLTSLAESISMYPSLLNIQSLGSSSRSVETLIKNLCSSDNFNFILNTPTKAILGRGFTIAKINFFFLLLYICSEMELLHDKKTEILNIISLNIFSITAEDVLISLVAGQELPDKIKHGAAVLLAKIWEFRIYKGVSEFAPILTELWKGKNEFTPSYGTMTGISEITNFCMNRNPIWMDFFEDDHFSDHELFSLKEYIMGLSFEEMKEIQNYMERESISSLKEININTLIKRRTYAVNDPDDPREMHHFYSLRKSAAEFRKKSKLDGPLKTIEEYIMCYLIEKRIIDTDINLED